MSPDDVRLKEALGGTGLERLLVRAKNRYVRGSFGGRLLLSGLNEVERDAIGKLIGRPISGCKSVTVDLDALDRLLRDSGMCSGLSEALVVLTGPFSDENEKRAAEIEKWKETYLRIANLCTPFPALLESFRALRDSGLLRRLSQNDADVALLLMKQAAEIAAGLPSDGIPLAELAVAITGDSHALDLGRPLNSILLRLASRLTGVVQTPGAESRRQLLMSVGVLCDELSGPVLVLNIRARPDNTSGRMLNVCAEVGEPLWLTYRQLRRDPPVFGPELRGTTVYVCENPTTVVAAANRLGAASASLICTDGQPKTVLLAPQP